MSKRINYHKISQALDYMVIQRKLDKMAVDGPPKRCRTVFEVLDPLREKLLALNRKGWTSNQLAAEMAKMGIPVSPSRIRDCFRRWRGRSYDRNAKNPADRG
jgi:hypothetical protein